MIVDDVWRSPRLNSSLTQIGVLLKLTLDKRSSLLVRGFNDDEIIVI
jgi:hypothetical protein